MKKSLAVVLTAALALSVFAALPAEAKKKKKKKPPVCAPYTPGELGAEAETLVITDAATAEAPVIQPLTFDPYFFEGISVNGVPGEAPTNTINVQVDSAAATAGLYVTFEFDEHRDYDLFVRWPDGSEAASSHGFNPLIDTQGQPENVDQSNTATNHAGETTAGSENIVGLITPDCGGYTVQFHNYFGEGGDFEAKIWLGEGTEEPLAPAPAEG
jgi:hypothetical protein